MADGVRRRRWAVWALVAAFALLLLGRFLSERTADRLWAAALGAEAPLGALAELRGMLLALALAGGAVWIVGNLYFLTRSIGSVQVPRRLGDIEILEQVPRHYLLLVLLAIGLVLAGLFGWAAGDWWRARALWDAAMPLGIQEPVLRRDIGWYLFRLPWLVTLHRFALLQTGVVLLVVTLLYALVGALRVRARTVAVSDFARVHVGGLLVAFALVLFWGYQLEPAEHVAGLSGVPHDTVLVAVRLPVARVLAALALVAGGAAAAWMWAGRAAIVVVPWLLLGAASFTGHFIAPALAAASQRPVSAVSADVLDRHAALAFGLPAEAEVALPRPVAAAVDGTPVWDAFAVAFTLDRTLPGEPWERFFDPQLALAGGRPVWLAVREVDPEAALAATGDLPWDAVHGSTYGRSRGVAMVDAVAVTPRGLPRYYRRLGEPAQDSATTLDVGGNGFWFTPATGDFALAPADGERRGVALGGFWRRLALAWALQSPQLLSSRFAADVQVLEERAVGRRLARYAPFARFGAAYPVLVRGRLVWAAPGYVWASAFPLVQPASWRGRPVRYLRLGFIGTVDAASGATTVYLAPGADPLSEAWARGLEPLVRPAAEMPEALRTALRYPDELFRVQADLLARAAGPDVHVSQPHATAGSGVDGGPLALRVRAALERDRVRVLLDGRMTADGPVLARHRLADSTAAFATRPLSQRLARGAAAVAAIPGPLKLAVGPGGLVGVQTFYADPGAPDVPPWVAGVAVGWDGAAGHGPDLAEARAHVMPAPLDRPAGADMLPTLREWFDRLDRARSAGDWEAFGEAWERLRALLADTLQ